MRVKVISQGLGWRPGPRCGKLAREENARPRTVTESGALPLRRCALLLTIRRLHSLAYEPRASRRVGNVPSERVAEEKRRRNREAPSALRNGWGFGKKTGERLLRTTGRRETRMATYMYRAQMSHVNRNSTSHHQREARTSGLPPECDEARPIHIHCDSSATVVFDLKARNRKSKKTEARLSHIPRTAN